MARSQRSLAERPLPPAVVTEELERLRKRRKWLAAEIVGSSIIALAGLSVGIALIVNGDTFFVASGIATCAFVASVCSIALWGLRAPKPLPEDAVEHAVAVARQNARVGVRHATSMIWAPSSASCSRRSCAWRAPF